MRAGAVAALLAAVAVMTACSVLQEAPGEQGETWTEAPLVLPAYPMEAGLVALDIGRPGDVFRYLIDLDSVSVGPDGVARLTVVLTSDGGGHNVRYEGIRCQSGSARTYAYGTGERSFRVLEGSDWQLLRQEGPGAYRYHLARGYVCTRRGLAYDRAALVARLKAGGAPGFHEPDGYR